MKHNQFSNFFWQGLISRLDHPYFPFFFCFSPVPGPENRCWRLSPHDSWFKFNLKNSQGLISDLRRLGYPDCHPHLHYWTKTLLGTLTSMSIQSKVTAISFKQCMALQIRRAFASYIWMMFNSFIFLKVVWAISTTSFHGNDLIIQMIHNMTILPDERALCYSNARRLCPTCTNVCLTKDTSLSVCMLLLCLKGRLRRTFCAKFKPCHLWGDINRRLTFWKAF